MADLVAQVKERCYEDCENLNFQTTPISKILILSIVTGGFYHIIWFYHYWKTLNQKFGLKISPFWRSLFSGITCFRLFPMLEIYSKRFRGTFNNATFCAILYFMLCWFSNKLDSKLALMDETSIILELVSLVLTLILTGIIISIQSNINSINREYYPNAEINKWKISNTVWTIICVVLTISYYVIL